MALLDTMEADHARIDPLIERVDATFVSGHNAGLAEAAGDLAVALETHLQHEEECALPLVERHLGPEGWNAIREAIRKRQGLKGTAEFLPWILDGTSEEVSEKVLDMLPAPARLLYWAVWRPGYARTLRWTDATN